jgi:transcription initiation factor IIF auxiliary subunit
MKDSAHRTMHEISVYYFDSGKYKECKFDFYLKDEAVTMYQRVINKFTESKSQVIIALRDEMNSMIKSIALNF